MESFRRVKWNELHVYTRYVKNHEEHKLEIRYDGTDNREAGGA